MASAERERVKIWDGPTRIFHWLLVLLIPIMWWTAENDQIGLHVTLGLLMVALLVFRLVWGVIGSSTARFANFLKGPRGVMSYLNGNAADAIGHNPIGGWSVVLMLTALCIQVGLGLFAEDNDGLAAGPLSDWLSIDTVERITELHEFMFNVLLALIALHVGAILYYAIAKRRNLVGPMITGRGTAPEGADPMRKASAIRFTLALLPSVAVAMWLWSTL
jgi:cytochrome b